MSVGRDADSGKLSVWLFIILATSLNEKGGSMFPPNVRFLSGFQGHGMLQENTIELRLSVCVCVRR